MRHSKRSLEGEIFIDHSASPGLTREEMGTFAGVPVAKGELYESAVVVCSHCQYAVVMDPKRTRDRGWCPKCDRYVCDECEEIRTKTLECRSFERYADDVRNAIERFGSSSDLLLKGSR